MQTTFPPHFSANTQVWHNNIFSIGEENYNMKEKANKLFEMLSQKDMSAETKAAVAGIIKENPDILISKEFMEKMAINDMSKCSKDGYQEYVKQSSDQLATSRQVLDNLHAMHKEGVLDTVKSGKTPVQYLLDEGRLPNGETLGTQSAKNIISLRAMQKDENYPDKEGITNLHNESTSLIQGMYANSGYGANPNRRNAKGEKMSDLMERHLGNVKKPMSREDLEVGAYRGTLTAEQADQLKKLQNKKDDDLIMHAYLLYYYGRRLYFTILNKNVMLKAKLIAFKHYV